MNRGFAFRIVGALLGLGLVATSTGCTEWLAISHVGSLSAGWLLRDVTMPTTVERECYENGVLVDCADLPADLGQ